MRLAVSRPLSVSDGQISSACGYLAPLADLIDGVVALGRRRFCKPLWHVAVLCKYEFGGFGSSCAHVTASGSWARERKFTGSSSRIQGIQE